MTVVVLVERRAGGDGSFELGVRFDGGGEHGVRVVDPFAGDAQSEALLAWYFEEHLRFPFLDKDREREAVETLATYGRELFAQVFEADARCRHEYVGLRDRGFGGCRLEVTGSAGLHRLHWEALRDPELDEPLAVRLPVVRRSARSGRPEPPFAPAEDQATLNILVVTARPDGPRDVGFRTISRPLLDAVERAGLPVRLELVRPGTWTALRAHLAAAGQQQGKTGGYHVVHFDVHGAVMDPAELVEGAGSRYLLAEDVPAGGRKSAFLFFETAQEGKADPVPAARIAELLEEHRVPIAVLNACQSAKAETDSEASLAEGLVAAGVPVAVGMAYSVTVSAARAMMPVLYRQLVDGVDVVDAAHRGRRQLFEERGRRAHFDQRLDLEDWVLPVVFQQQPVRTELRAMTPDEEAAFSERQARVPDEPRPAYGFVGRDLDVQAIERRLLGDGADAGNELLVKGMAGAGKTTLLEHLAWWWPRTGLVERTFRFSYEDQAWSLAAILHHLGDALFDPAERAKVESLPDDARLERIAGELRTERHLLVVDNAESITASPASIPHALDPDEQAKLRRFLSRLRGGKTLVLVGSRIAESWLAPGTFGRNVHELGGLDPQAVSLLVDRALTRHGGRHHLDTPEERRALQELTELLGGYPLPLTVVLPALAATPPSQVLADLRSGGEATDPASAIQRAIEYSHGRLDPAAQRALLLLAPFTTVVPVAALTDYEQLLREHGLDASDGIDLAGAVQQAVDAGLAAPYRHLTEHVRVQPVLPYFLRVRLNQHPDLAVIARNAHRDLYIKLGEAIWDLLLSSDPRQRHLGRVAGQAEYTNLTTALDRAIETRAPLRPLVGSIEELLDQSHQHDTRRQILEDTIRRVSGHGRADPIELAQLLHLAGGTALAQHRLDDALSHYTDELRIHERSGDRRYAAGVYQRLGEVAHAQQRLEEAEAHYRHALTLNLELDDRDGAAGNYHHLGMVAQAQHRFEEAEAHYRRVLEIRLELDDRYGAAPTYHQLGMIAHKRWRFEEAEAHYRQALAIRREFNDPSHAARTYHQLGVVARDQRRFEEAEGYFREALTIKLKLNDRHGATLTYYQLGAISQDQGRFEEAEGHYRQVLTISRELGNRRGVAASYHQLGLLAQEQQRFEEAERHYHEALTMKLELEDRGGAAATYYQLGMLAHEQRRVEEAEGHYRQALTRVLDLNDRFNAARTYSQLGILLTETGRIDSAVEHSLQALVLRRETVGRWSLTDLSWLKTQRRLLGADKFDALVDTLAPSDIARSLPDLFDKVDEAATGEDG